MWEPAPTGSASTEAADHTSPLYDSSNKYDIEWPDFDAFGRKYGPSTLDLDLPMRWDGLEQAPTPVGPKRKATDNLPSLDGFFGNIFEFAAFREVKKLAESWQHPRDASLNMYYTVAWDWRRDFYAEAPRVLAALQNIHSKTGCKAIMVGHSFGGRLLYATLARFGAEAADLTAATLYATAALHGSGNQIASLSIDPDVPVSADQQPVDTLFTFTSLYTLAPTTTRACRNTDALFSTSTFPCPPDSDPTGISCDSPACGRPAGWPAGQPFFLPLDMQDPDVWLKIQAAQPTLQEITAAEDLQLRKALETARRSSDSMSGDGVAAVQQVHPPAAVISMALSDPSLDPSPEKPAAMKSYVTCEPAAAFGKEGAGPWCSSLKAGGSVRGDGRLTAYMQELTGPGWDDIVQTFRMVTPPAKWPPPLSGPHSAALLLAENPFRRLRCAEQPLPNPACAGGKYPSLEQLLCSLAYRADNPGTAPPTIPCD
eukprot:jgi/Ulvmu1/1685/UM115_0014.1